MEYKFFDPHAGALYGKFDLLNALKAYKVRPAADELPYKFETGALEYFAWIGNQVGEQYAQT